MKERVARFGESRSLAGVVTEPDDTTKRSDYPAVLFLNAGLLHHVGPNRLHVRLARRLSRLGITSLRFDLSGLGDSLARRGRVPRRESKIRETQEAMDYLAEYHGARRFILFGLCSGADQAFCAGREDSRVVGLVLIDGYLYRTKGLYIRHYGRRLLSAKSWLNIFTGRHPDVARLVGKVARKEVMPAPRALDLYPLPAREETETRLRAFVERNVNLCLIFTPSTRYNYRKQFWAAFPSLRPGPRIRVEYFRHASHTFILLASQQRLMDCVESWIRDSQWPEVPLGTDSGTPSEAAEKSV